MMTCFALWLSWWKRLSRRSNSSSWWRALLCDCPGGNVSAYVPTLRPYDVPCFVTVQKHLSRRSSSSSWWRPLFCDGPGKLPADVPTLRLDDALCFLTVQKTLERRSNSSPWWRALFPDGPGKLPVDVLTPRLGDVLCFVMACWFVPATSFETVPLYALVSSLPMMMTSLWCLLSDPYQQSCFLVLAGPGRKSRCVKHPSTALMR